MVKANDLTVKVNEMDLYASAYQDPILSIQTYYEKKWIEHGLAIKYLQFELLPLDEWVEPDVEIEFDQYHNAGRGVKVKESLANQPQAKNKGK